MERIAALQKKERKLKKMLEKKERRKARKEEERKAAEAEEARKAAEEEEARKAAEAEEAERAKKAEEAKKARKAEKAKQARKAEKARKAEEAEKARKAEEEAKKAEEEEEENDDEEEENQIVKGKRKLATERKVVGIKAKKQKIEKKTVDESPKRITRSTTMKTVEEEDKEDSEIEKSEEENKDELTKEEEEEIEPKKPQKKETTTVYRTFRTRSSPKPLFDATNNLTNERKRCLKEMGFETMINFPLNELPGSLGYYVLEHFHPKSMELRLERGSIKVTRQKIHDMLGVPMGRRKIDEMEPREWNDEFVIRWEQQYYVRGKKEKATPAAIAKQINCTSNADFLFKINFLTLFASTMGTLDSGGKCPDNVLRNVREDDDIADIDWCGYILDCLEGSKHNWEDVKRSGNYYYYGPLTLLNVRYFSFFYYKSI